MKGFDVLHRIDAGCRTSSGSGRLSECDRYLRELCYGVSRTVFNELAAKVIAAQMFNEPIPLEADLLRAIDPGRFFKKPR